MRDIMFAVALTITSLAIATRDARSQMYDDAKKEVAKVESASGVEEKVDPASLKRNIEEMKSELRELAKQVNLLRVSQQEKWREIERRLASLESSRDGRVISVPPMRQGPAAERHNSVIVENRMSVPCDFSVSGHSFVIPPGESRSLPIQLLGAFTYTARRQGETAGTTKTTSIGRNERLTIRVDP